MTNIYDKHDAAFRNVSAFVVLGRNTDENGDTVHVATVSLKHGGSVTAFVHWIGTEMTQGRAGGGGYDRSSAAVADAARKAIAAAAKGAKWEATQPGDLDRAVFFKTASTYDGKRWDSALRDAGFTVIQAL